MGPIDDVKFDELMIAVQKQREESGFLVRDKNEEVAEFSGDYKTDADLRQLTGMSELERLDLIGCAKITDAGLVHLKDLTNLEHLVLSFCENITDSGIAELQKALPNCVIFQ